MLVLAALLGALSAPTPKATTAPGPAAIYRSALERLSDLPAPAFIDSTMHWDVVAETPQGDRPSAFDERVLFDSSARRECVLFLPYSSGNRVIIGPSYFAPDMWLLRKPPEHAAQPAHQDFSPDLSDLRTIAAVVSVAKPAYRIRLVGEDPLTNGGGNAYHLVLEPRSDPARHNLRELWINTGNFNIVRAVLVGDYRPDNGQLIEQTAVAEDFGSVGPYWVVIHHTWSYRDAPNSVTFHYDVTAQNMSFPGTIPAWYFDQAQFDRHRAEVNTSLQWP